MKKNNTRDIFLSTVLSDKEYGNPSIREKYSSLTYGIEKRPLEEDEDQQRKIQDSIITLRNPGRGYLFDYQHELADKIIDLAHSQPPQNIGLVALPTGAGKTRTALWAILDLLKGQSITSVLWLAPMRELLDQAADTAVALWNVIPALETLRLVKCHLGGMLLGVEGKAIYFATPQMMSHRLKSRRDDTLQYDLIIFDEAHHAIAPIFLETVVSLRECGSREATTIGLSATPGRGEDEETESLVKFFRRRLLVSKLLGKNPVESLQKRGVLSALEFKRIPLDRSWPGIVVEKHGERKLSIRELETESSRFRSIIQLVKSLPGEDRVLIFAGSISHANAIQVVLENLGCRSAVISSDTPLEIRSDLINAFKNGQIKVLVNKQILATGYDCPSVKHVILTVPIGSSILFEQIVGRASRGPLVGGNETSIIWQIDDNLGIHGYPSSYYRFKDFDWT